MADGLANTGCDAVVVGAEHDPNWLGRGDILRGRGWLRRQDDVSFEGDARSYIKATVLRFERKEDFPR